MTKQSTDHDTMVIHAPVQRTRKIPKKIITWGGFTLAFIMLINPMPMLLDLLPDALAYLIILFSLRRSIGEVDVFDDFKASTKKLLILSAVKIPSFFVMCYIWGGDPRERSIVAVFALSFAIFEFLFLRTWTHDMFNAIARYGQRYNCDAALSGRKSPDRRGFDPLRLAPEVLEIVTIVYFAIRSALACLPEICLAPYYKPEDDPPAFNWNNFFPIAVIAAAVIGVVIGAIWLIYMGTYISRIKRDKAAEARIAGDVTIGSYAERKNTYQQITLLTFLLAAAVALQFDFVLDSTNYIPDVLSGVLFIILGFCLYSLLEKNYLLRTLPIFYTIATVFYTIYYDNYYARFTDSDFVKGISEAREAYLYVTVSGAISSILLIGVLITVVLAFTEIVKRYTGITTGGLNAIRLEEQIRHAPPAEAVTLRKAYNVIAERTKRELTVKLYVLAALGALSALSVLVVDLILFMAPPPMGVDNPVPDFKTLLAYGGVDAIAMVVIIAAFALALHIGARIRREAELNLIEE